LNRVRIETLIVVHLATTFLTLYGGFYKYLLQLQMWGKEFANNHIILCTETQELRKYLIARMRRWEEV